MKFPKSIHAEGWGQHIEHADGPAGRHGKPGHKTGHKPGNKAGAKPVSWHTPLHGEPVPRASAAPQATRSQPAAATPWLLGAGVMAALIGGAVAMSRHIGEPAAPVVVGQVTLSVEDGQLQDAPPSAGAVAPAPEVAPAPAPPAEAAKPAPAETRTAQAPEPKREPEPVVRTLVPPPEVLAEIAPEPEAAPVAQAPAAPELEDAGITVQVRQALAADATLAAVPIAVSTAQGVVKLEGQAPDAEARERATVVAAATTGVKAVDNRLTLPPLALLVPPPPASGG